MSEFRPFVSRIHEAQAELVILGNGSPQDARWFLEDYDLGVPVVVDPERETYRIAGAKRPKTPLPGTLKAGWRAFRKGFRQTKTRGDAAQIGGVFVITPNGGMPYSYLSRYAGDHPDPALPVAAVERLTPSPEEWRSGSRGET